MRRALAIASLALCLCACAAGGSYSLDTGDADYMAIKKAADACKAKGGELQPKKDGDPHELSDYECKIGKGN